MSQRYMTQAEAAAYVGLSVNTFKANVRPHLKEKPVGRKVMFCQSDIDNYMTMETWEIKRQLRRRSA